MTPATRAYARLRWLVVGALLVPAIGLFAVWYQQTYLAQQREIRRIEAHKLTLDAVNTQSRSLVGSLSRDTLATVLRQFDQQAAYVARLVPPDTIKSTLLPQITAAAEQYGVQIKKMTPVAAGVQLGYTTSGYDVTLAGGYHEIAAALGALLSLDHITQLRDVKLRAVARGAVQTPDAPRGAKPGPLDRAAVITARETEASFIIRSFAAPVAAPVDSTARPAAATDSAAPARPRRPA